MDTPCRSSGRGHAALRRGRISLPGHAYHLTFTTRDREPVFARHAAATAAARCFGRTEATGDATPLAWVLMPDHVHCLLVLGTRDRLGTVANRLKSAIAREVNRIEGRHGALWSRAYHDHAVRADEDLAATARYIIANPVRAGLVERVDEYPYWAAIWIPRP